MWGVSNWWWQLVVHQDNLQYNISDVAELSCWWYSLNKVNILRGHVCECMYSCATSKRRRNKLLYTSSTALSNVIYKNEFPRRWKVHPSYSAAHSNKGQVSKEMKNSIALFGLSWSMLVTWQRAITKSSTSKMSRKTIDWHVISSYPDGKHVALVTNMIKMKFFKKTSVFSPRFCLT